MSDIAIRVAGLGKEYRIGGRQEKYKSLRDTLAEAALRPVRALQSLRHRNGRHREEADQTLWALRDLSFDVKHGEVIGIIGRNGAGKSTLLKILSRITEPTAGVAEIHGRVGALLEVGTGFHAELTGRENILLNGAILGMRKAEIERKFDEMVAFAEVEKFIDTPVKHYSSGMYLRLAFAVAAHLQMENLLVDEVLAVGDAAFQKKCLGKMGDVAKHGRTVFFVSHNLTALKSLCTRAICLREGHLVNDGDASTVVAQYLKSFGSENPQRVWENPREAPGNEKVRLHSVTVRPVTDEANADITLETPISIEIEFWNYLVDASLNLSLMLYTMEDVCVCNTGSVVRQFPAGLVHGTCRIPANLLNNQGYRLRLMIVKDGSVVLYDHDHLATFEVKETHRQGPWYGKWQGVIRPQLEWHTNSCVKSTELEPLSR